MDIWGHGQSGTIWTSGDTFLDIRGQSPGVHMSVKSVPSCPQKCPQMSDIQGHGQSGTIWTSGDTFMDIWGQSPNVQKGGEKVSPVVQNNVPKFGHLGTLLWTPGDSPQMSTSGEKVSSVVLKNVPKCQTSRDI